MKKSLFLLIAILLLFSLVLSSCGDNAGAGDMEAPSKGDAVQDTATDTGIVDNRKVVITAKYTIESLEFDTATDAIENAVTAVGGYISSSQVTPSTEKRQGSATYVLKVPAENTDGFKDTLEGIGHVVNRSISTSDVTLTYTDLTARITTLEAEEARVRELLENASSLTEIMTIDKRLTEISSELTSLKNQLAALQNRVTYSTFNVTIKDVTEYTVEEEQTEGYFARFGRSFVSSFGIFVDVLGSILIVVVYLLPYALVAGAVIFIIWFVKRRKKVAKPVEEQPAEEQPAVQEQPSSEGLFPQE